MSDEEKNKTKDELKKQTKTVSRFLKALALGVGLSGAAGEVKGEVREDFSPEPVESTYEPQSNIGRRTRSISYDEAVAIASNSSNRSARLNPWDYSSPDEYAYALGYRRDYRLSQGLNHIGDRNGFSGYAGAYVNDAKRGQHDEVLFLPNDLERDYNKMYSSSMKNAVGQQRGGKNAYDHKSHSVNGRCPDAGIETYVKRGSKTDKTLRKVDGVVRTVDGILRILGDRRGR